MTGWLKKRRLRWKRKNLGKKLQLKKVKREKRLWGEDENKDNVEENKSRKLKDAKVTHEEANGSEPEGPGEEENKIEAEIKEGENQTDVRVDEPKQSTKDVMNQAIGIPEEVAQAIEAITKGAKEEGKGPFGVDLSFPQISKAALMEAKAKTDLGQRISCVPDPDAKMDKTWDLHKAYHFVRMGYNHGHNLSVNSIHTLIGNQQVNSLVSLTDVHF